jgi:steroid 5-alpha reductase family enzyme
MTALIESRPLLAAALCALAALAALAFCTWLVSLAKRDVSIVDSVWSLMILLAAAVYALLLPQAGDRTGVVLALTALWALRLAGYITWRNHGAGEDRRYQDIRARNQPHFEWKSLYLVFGLQAVLAWLVSLSLLAAMADMRAWGWLDTLGVATVLFGIAFETLGDAQLASFKAKSENRGRVMERGLWRYTRHPNYFGEFCVWWGFYLMTLSAGAWWALVSPLLMSVLLLKVSGVTLLEKDIGERRPAYRDYVARTNAFFPGRPKA